MALLEVSNLGIAFGGLQAVSQLDLKIEKGHLYGLIGPNGAGKTTVFNMLTGVYKPTEGNIVLDGNDITGATPEAISKAGIARTFQNIRLFNDMTVLDNVKVGLHNQVVYGMWTGILRLPSFREKEHEMDRRAMKLLKIFDLDAEANYKASQLPYGKQRKLEIARALATNPKLLLLAGLDEPYGILAKEELGKIPLLNRWMKLLGCVFVQRDDLRASVRALNDATAIVESGRSFVIFPEGTREKEGKLLPPKSGLFVIAAGAGVDVVPCRILYDTPDGKMHLFCKVRVIYGEPMPAAQFAMEGRRDTKKLRANKQALLDAWEKMGR